MMMTSSPMTQSWAAWRSWGGGVAPGVGGPPGGSVRGVAFELAHPLLERPHLADELREQGLGGPDAACLHGGAARGAAPHPARLDIAGHPGLRGHDGPRGHRDMIGDADLSGKDGAIADGARAGDTDLRDENDVLPHLAVMPDLYEVVDLAPAPDER